MRKHTIGQRLTVAFGALAVVTIISGVASLNITRGLANRLDKAVNVIGREQVLAGTLNTAASEMVASERGIAFSTVLQQFDKSEKFKQQFGSAAAAAKSALAELRPLATDATLQSHLTQLDGELSEVGRAHVDMMRMLANQQIDAALKYFDDTILPKLTSLGATSKRLADGASSQLALVSEEANGLNTRAVWLTLALLVVSIAFGIAVIFMVRHATESLRRLTGQMAASGAKTSRTSSYRR